MEGGSNEHMFRINSDLASLRTDPYHIEDGYGNGCGEQSTCKLCKHANNHYYAVVYFIFSLRLFDWRTGTWIAETGTNPFQKSLALTTPNGQYKDKSNHKSHGQSRHSKREPDQQDQEHPR